MSLYRNINNKKRAGTSNPKSKSTISPKAYANMKAGFPKKKKEKDMNDPIKTTFKYDHNEDKVILNNVQDIQPIIELNKKEQNNDSMYGIGENAAGMRKVASIPLVVIEKWKRELGVDIMNKNDWPKIKQLLNDPENRFFRTNESKL